MENLEMKKSFYKNKKILITGHTGFKGSWLTKILAMRGAKLVGIALPSPTKPNLFETLKLEKQIKNFNIDIRNFDKVLEMVASEKPEIVFHFAAQPIVRDSYDDPLNTYSTNIIGTANILEAIRKVNTVKSAVIITTDKVYENKEWVYPYREVDPLGGHDPYGASKASADIVTNSYIQSFFNPNDYGTKHHTLVAIARAGNVIGGGDWAKDRLIPDIIRSIYEKNDKITIRNPQAVRPWEHVLEPLSGYLLLAQKLCEKNKSLSGAWNFGPDDESFTTVETLVTGTIKFLKKGKYKIQNVKTKHEASLLKLDISKAKDILGWHPTLSLENALILTFNWYNTFYKDSKDIIRLTEKQIRDFFNSYEAGTYRTN